MCSMRCWSWQRCKCRWKCLPWTLAGRKSQSRGLRVAAACFASFLFQGESLKDPLSPALFLKHFISRFAVCRGPSTARCGGASGASRAHSRLHIHCDPGHFPVGEYAEDGSLWAQLCQGLGQRSRFLLPNVSRIAVETCGGSVLSFGPIGGCPFHRQRSPQLYHHR